MRINKILVTGCTGHLGGAVVEKLAQQGQRIICLARKITPSLKYFEERYGCSLVFCDLTKEGEMGELRKTLSEVDSVIHLAGFVPKSAQEDNARDAINGNLLAAFNLVKNIPQKAKFIFASTCEVYGEVQISPITENHPLHPLSYYGMSKAATENILRVYCRRNDISLTILRFTTIYGPGEIIDRAIPNFIKTITNGERPKVFGDGSDLRDYLYITDAANYVLAALQTGKDKTYNIATGKSISIKEVAEKIIRLAGNSLRIDFQKRQNTSVHYIFDISRAREDLDYTPQVELEEGLLNEIEWYTKKHK